MDAGLLEFIQALVATVASGVVAEVGHLEVVAQHALSFCVFCTSISMCEGISNPAAFARTQEKGGGGGSDLNWAAVSSGFLFTGCKNRR